jgi:hypothetical protein
MFLIIGHVESRLVTVASVFKRGLGIRVVSLVKIMMFELIQHDTIVS